MRRVFVFLAAWLALTTGVVLSSDAYWQSRSQVSVSTVSAECQQFLSRITDPGATRNALYCTLIDGIVADGVWTKLDKLEIWAADIQGNALVNLKSSSFSPSTLTGTVSFSADHGFTGNAGNFFLDTGFNPNTAGGNYTQDSASWGAYVLTSRAATANKSNFGADNSGAFTRVANLNVFDTGGGGTVSTFTNNATASSSAAPGTSQGSWGVSRTGATAGSITRNGAQVTTFVTASVGLPTANFYFFAVNIGGTFGAVADQMAAGYIGGGLTSAEQNNLSNRINIYMTNLPTPINVY